MSALTKVFIVLHVVMTMLFVSAAIVFVNRAENSNAAAATAQRAEGIARRQAESALGEAQVARADAAAVKLQSANEVARIRQQLNAALTDVRERDTQLAQLQQNLAAADARLQAATTALGTAQESNKLLTAQISETRESSNKIQRQNTELLTANSDLNSRLQTAIRSLRAANEEIDELKGAVADVQDRGGPAVAARGGGQQRPEVRPSIPINGVIRDRRNVNGVPYATISIGSADQVTENMVFNIVDREQGDFLGYLRVDRVEPNEAVGRIEGPRVGDVKPGNEVRTQL